MYNPHTLNFLDFVPENDKKNAYAPSLGTFELPDSYKRLLQDKLKSFKNLSCRERKGCELISGLVGKKVNYVLDPTLLLSGKEWSNIALPVEMPEKYILCYILGEKMCISEFAETLGREKGMPVYYIVTRPLYLNKMNKLLGIGPAHFISLIKNCTYLCTDSFHGSIFAINFNKQFYSFTKRESNDPTNDNVRILEILSEFSLEDRFRKDDDTHFTCDIDYDKVNDRLLQLRNSSLIYLKGII